MKKWWLVISVTVVIAMLGAGAIAAFHGNQQGEDYGYGAEVDADVDGTDIPQARDYGYGDEAGLDVAAKVVHRGPPRGTPLPLPRAIMVSPEHVEAHEELREAIPHLIAQGIPVVDFCVTFELVHRDTAACGMVISPEQVEAYEKLREATPHCEELPYWKAHATPVLDFCRRHFAPDLDNITAVMIVQVGLREVRDEYKWPIKAIVEGIEYIEFDFFQAEFTREQMAAWRDKILRTFWLLCHPPAGIIEVPVSGFETRSLWRCQKIMVVITGTDIQPQYIEAVRAVVGNEVPLQFMADGDVHTEAYDKLVDAIPHLNAQGIPVVDFWRQRRTPDPQNIISVMIVQAGLREVKDEYKEAIKAIVEGIEGIEFDFFQAEFTMEEIHQWASKIRKTFSRLWDLPPGIIEVPVSFAWASWRCQEITVRIAGEIKPRYIEAVRALVGDKAPQLHFRSGGRVPPDTRYWHKMPVPDEEREKHDIFVHVFEQLFPELDMSNMRIGEVEEFIKGLNVEEATELMRMVLDYSLERGLVTPGERQELEEEMLQEWLEWRQE